MKQYADNRRNKIAKRRTKGAHGSSRYRLAFLERLDDRILLDADGLEITSASAQSIRGGETLVTNVTTDDPAATFSISGGADAASFSIDPTAGTLTFNLAPDFGNPTDSGNDNIYEVTVRAADSFANVAEQPLAITVLPANVAPQVMASNYTVVENQFAVGAISASDANTSDAGGDILHFSFTNSADADTFHLDPASGLLSFILPPDFESGNTSYSIDVAVVDALGLSDTATQTVTVTNVDEPVVSNAGDLVLPVGQPANNSGTWSHPTAAPVTLLATSGTVTQNGNGTWDWSGDGPSGPSDRSFVTISALDNAGNMATTTFSISGKNTAPLLTITEPTVTVGEADTASNTGTIADLDGDIVTLWSSIGTIVHQANGTWDWSLATTDGPLESQYVGVIATDSFGSSRGMSFQLVVQNVPPTVSVDQETVSTDEGNTVVNSGTFADVGNDIVTVTSDIGTAITNPDGTWSWSYLAPNGPATETVTVTATDSDGAQTSETFTVSVANVAPAVAADVADVTVNEGDAATVTGTMSDQAIPADSITLNASLGTITDNGNGTWQWTHNVADGPDESATVTVTADDGDGGVSTTTFDLAVVNVAPAVNVDNATITVAEGATATNTGTISDVGADTVSLSASRGIVVAPGDGTWAWSFDTQDGPDDSGPITITATDSDGAQSSVQFTLTVDNTAPTIAVNGAPATVTVTEGDTASIAGTYVEPGPSDAVTLTASVGTIVDNGDDTWSWSLITTDGTDQTQTVTVTITDSEGTQGTATFDLVVNNAAPTIALAATNLVTDEGATAANTITITDPGDDTIQSLTASVGSVSDNGDGTWAWSYLAPNGPSTETVTITATDSDGDATSLSFSLQIDNVAPAVATDVASVTINEGETANVTGTMSDQAVPADAITLTSSLDGSWSHVYTRCRRLVLGLHRSRWRRLAPDGHCCGARRRWCGYANNL